MSKLITVVVAVYNVEKYLDACVVSILSQTHKELQVILVDDGSTDSSGEMCDKYAELDSRVQVIHKVNGGLSDARNAGLEMARGEYLMFCDGDDWIEVDVLQNAYESIEKDNADVAIWGYYADFVDKEDKLIRRVAHKCSSIVCAKNINAEILLERESLGLIGYAWNKLYKASLISESQYKFQKGLSLVEDVVFNTPVLLQANKVVFVDTIGTHYMQRPRITLGTKYYTNYFELKIMACEAREALLKGYQIDDLKVQEALSTLYTGAVLSSVKMIKYASNMDKEEKKVALRELHYQIEKGRVWSKCRKVTIEEKCFLYMVYKKWFDILLKLPIL